MVKNGVPCQMATTITDQSARLGSARNWINVFCSKKAMRT
jgi:hypothetical protein